MRRSKPRASASPPRSAWFDPRFGIGVALVIASVVGVVWLVSAADRTVAVWAAASSLSPGERVDADDLVLRNVRLGDTGDRYLGVSDLPLDGVVLTREVAEGELVPVSAVGSRTGVRVASVVVTTSATLSRGVVAGSVVDLWSASETDDGGFGPPSVLVGSATVVRVLETNGLIVDDANTGVEVLVPRSKIASVLEAIANDDAVSLVPTSLPIGG